MLEYLSSGITASFDMYFHREAYAQANMVEYQEHDPIVGRAILQRHGDRLLIVNPPAMPLTTAELDAVAELPYVREPHPMYDDMGGVPAIEEVRFSITHNRGCFGACNFCSLAFHQGRMVTSRSHESVIREVTEPSGRVSTWFWAWLSRSRRVCSSNCAARWR